MSTLLKLLLILVFIVCGWLTPVQQTDFSFSSDHLSFIQSKSFATSLIYVSFAYSGWNACVYIFQELQDPTQNIKKAILTGTLLVTVLYMALNYVFLKTVPISELQDVVEVGAKSANVIFGYSGGKIMAGLICLLLVSSISAMVWTGSRVIAKMQSELFPHKAKGLDVIPLRSLGIQYIITLALLLTESFEHILMYTSVILMLSSCLAVAALLKRKHQTNITRLIPPVIFILLTLYAITVLLR